MSSFKRDKKMSSIDIALISSSGGPNLIIIYPIISCSKIVFLHFEKTYPLIVCMQYPCKIK